MLRKFFVTVAFMAVVFGFTGLNQASAMSTLDKYKGSNLFVIAMENNVAMYAEPVLDSLTLGFYPKGTMFVPINQQKNAMDGTVYNLVIRADGAIGWVLADKVAITHK